MTEATIHPEARDAARALERHTFLNPSLHPDEFLMARRHSTDLKRLFGELLGYRVVIEPTFARLLKPQLPDTSPARSMKTASGNPVTARVYQYVSLVGAALLASGAADQLLISDLVAQVRSDATTAGIVTGETITERRDFVTAVNILVRWGVITETDGTAAAWAADQAEALLTVDRAALAYLIVNQPGMEMAVTPARSLARRLVEDTVMNRPDLTDDEQRIWSRDRATVEQRIDEMFGLQVEARREGALAWDDDDDATDEPFPGPGAARQVSLMFIGEVAAARRPGENGTVVLTRDDAAEIIGVILSENLGHLRSDYETSGANSERRVLDEVLAVLTAVGLASSADGNVTIHPAAARYRTSVMRRPKAAALPDGTVTLFDDLEAGS
jgi:hypothetical protein